MPSPATHLSALLGGIALLISTTASAHHSGAMFDHTKLVKVEGTVKTWLWANPHSWLTLVHSDGKGGEIEESFETGSPNTMYRDGWRNDSFKPGDKITVTAFPRNDQPTNGMMVSAITAGGTLLEWLPRQATEGATLVDR